MDISGLLEAITKAAGMYGSAHQPYTKEQAQGMLSGLLDFTPVVGDIKSAAEGVQAAREGDYLGAAGGLLGALPFVPAMGGLIKSSDFLKKNPEFSKSKISKDSELQVGYHATDKDFEKFDPSLSRNKAIYFGVKPEVVEGMGYGAKDGGRTIPAYVNVTNPASNALYLELRRKYGTRNVVEELKKLGYDGVEVDPNSGFFMAFSPDQIKSAISP